MITGRWLSTRSLLTAIILTTSATIAAQPPATPAGSTPAMQLRYGQNPAAGQTLQVGDARIYYESYGEGPIVVLLHGALFGSISEFSPLIPTLSANRRVIAIATRGHPGSELGTEPLTYDRTTADHVAVIRHVTNEPVDLVGFSAGGVSAMKIVAQHPDLVRRAVVIGSPMRRDAYTPTAWATLARLTAADLERQMPDFVRARRAQLPGPDGWERFVSAVANMRNAPEYVTRAQLTSVSRPVLLVGADNDPNVRPEHVLETWRLIPGAQAALIPGCGHVVLACRPDLVRALVQNFLDKPEPAGEQ